jgi:hypothetical protein
MVQAALVTYAGEQQTRDVQKLTPGPIGVGTRYRVRFGRGIGTATIDNTAFDLPRYWSAVSRPRRLDVRAEGSVVETAPGSSTVGSHRIAATRPLVPPCPGSRTGLRRSWERDLRRIETITESSR